MHGDPSDGPGGVFQGKKLPPGTEGDGEVSDEDEGGSSRADSRRVPLCQELSDLISLHRSRLAETGLRERGTWGTETAGLRERGTWGAETAGLRGRGTW